MILMRYGAAIGHCVEWIHGDPPRGEAARHEGPAASGEQVDELVVGGTVRLVLREGVTRDALEGAASSG
jgi:hypothetical protein